MELRFSSDVPFWWREPMRCTEPCGLIADIKANGSAAVCQLISADP